MNPRELIVLSPYRVPAKDSLMLGDEDVAAFLNAYTTLWHPLALHGAGAPPRVASPYDYDNPSAGHVYAIPDSPAVFLPDDWDQRVRDAGAVAFRAGADRETTLVNMKEAFRAYFAHGSCVAGAERSEAPVGAESGASASLSPGHPSLTLSPGHADTTALLDLDAPQVAPFFGIGFGHMHLAALFDAMDHDNVLSGTEFWQDVQEAVAALLRSDAAACRASLQSAADRLMAGREAVYPATVHVVDVCLLDEQPRERPLPAAVEHGAPLNVITSGSFLESLASEPSKAMDRLRELVQSEHVEVCAGAYIEREDALLPLESQLWNLLKGLNVCRELLGSDVRTYARKRFGSPVHLPLLLGSSGLQRALLLSFDDSSLPSYRTTVVNWPMPDARQVEAFTRCPYRADSPQTYFHIGHYLQQTIAQDFAATLALVHRDKPAAPWYQDWLELSRLAPVLGKWTTLSGYFTEVTSGEQGSTSADEFQADHLTERTEAHCDRPVSAFARHARFRRRIDTVYTLAALYRGLVGTNDQLLLEAQLADVEDRLEKGEDREVELAEAQKSVGQALAERLLSRASDANPGFLILNPCSFTRRVALELHGLTGELPVEGPLKACQIDADQARLVVEVPALGFAWVPRTGGLTPHRSPAKRIRLADERHVRNEFFEASVDPITGGLRGLWDHRTPVSRIGQQLVYNPGSTMRVSSIQVTSAGPALGEVVSEGAILDEHEKVLAKFRQRFRAWLGRPVLEMRIEIYPDHSPAGYPWHAYYGARFAWRDERALLLRGVHGTGTITSHTRPESPDYLEWRLGKQSTILFTGGLPFQQRHGSRMLDVILVPEGETGRTFDLALGLDREHPMQTALGMITPVAVVPVATGPPHIGAAGWLFHLDAPNLLLTGMRPAPAGEDAVTARLLECSTYSTHAELRCVRKPQRAVLLNAGGEYVSEASVQEDAAVFDVNAGDFAQLRVHFS